MLTGPENQSIVLPDFIIEKQDFQI